ncbi:anti-phage deoxyguanosine triphosphatase [Thermoflavimicrobium dichotomicum]|uniref:Deoxyguanosinetriphosphate triphosphohydrolase-like protein n=1 Tax=Thermoflavimicrobium dichotomicum TaxID=46223 RepID=A0A1I3QG10_9BACL|nr:anti-phage deoxyguanosine triphosphatase [Thermoflavimicrobium dichotomicum]SFJ32695.1 dGTPase [Thermoflavimicrobium dichotomicum]
MIIQRVTQNRLYDASDMQRRFSPTVSSPPDARDAFEKDYGRIIHSAAFRRLQAKTQVLGQNAGDVHRTRLTHSMEVAQIARGIAIYLNTNHPLFREDFALDGSLLEAAGLAHDIGHPPFGHRGEQAFHECMQHFGGFEANAQTFRILTRLEGENEQGLDLTRGLLLSVMKYPILLDQAINPRQYELEMIPPKSSIYTCDEEVFQWVLAPFTDREKAFLTDVKLHPRKHAQTINKTLECSIIELADDIAYGTHDVEDAINLGFIRISQLKELLNDFADVSLYPKLAKARDDLDHLQEHDLDKYRLKKIISALISTFIYGLTVVENEGSLQSPRCKYRVVLVPELRKLLNQLREIVAEYVINSHKVQTVNWRGSFILKRLFEAIMNETRLLPEKDRLKMTPEIHDEQRARIICDYLSGMTDSFALRMYERLFGHSRNFFDY